MTIADMKKAIIAHYAQFGRRRERPRPLYLVQHGDAIAAVAVGWDGELVELGRWPIGTAGGSGVVRLAPDRVADLPDGARLDLSRGLAYVGEDPLTRRSTWMRVSGAEVLP